MPDTSIATEVHESFDVHGDFAAQVAFNRILRHFSPEGVEFLLGELHDFRLRCNIRGIANFIRSGSADPVDSRQRKPCLLSVWYVYTGNSSHLNFVTCINLGAACVCRRGRSLEPPPYDE